MLHILRDLVYDINDTSSLFLAVLPEVQVLSFLTASSLRRPEVILEPELNTKFCTAGISTLPCLLMHKCFILYVISQNTATVLQIPTAQ